ncbi:MAG: hypothetical protein VW870_10805, partial [Rhodobiaceae bacterium]
MGIWRDHLAEASGSQNSEIQGLEFRIFLCPESLKSFVLAEMPIDLMRLLLLVFPSHFTGCISH